MKRQEKNENQEKKSDFSNLSAIVGLPVSDLIFDSCSLIPVVRNISFKTYEKLRRINGVGFVVIAMTPYVYKIGFYAIIKEVDLDLKIKKASVIESSKIKARVNPNLDRPGLLFDLSSTKLTWLN